MLRLCLRIALALAARVLLESSAVERLRLALAALDGGGESLRVQRSVIRVSREPRALELLEDRLALLVHLGDGGGELAGLLGRAVCGCSDLRLLALGRRLGGQTHKRAERLELLLNRGDRLLGVGGVHRDVLDVSHFERVRCFMAFQGQ